MKRNCIFLMLLFCGFKSWAQIGINTDNPKATLHVKESNSSSLTFPEGIIAPQFSGNDLNLKNDHILN